MIHQKSPIRRAAFTLIELLVVITIISLLISILLPALAQAKKTAKMLLEQAAGNQLMTGYNSYSTDYKDGLMIPYIHWSWAHPSVGPIQVRPQDFTNSPSDSIEGDTVKVWPLRFMYYAGGSGGALPPEAMVNDKAFLASLKARDRTPAGGGGGGVVDYSVVTKYQYGMGWHPSFGLNSIYVGGHYRRGAFSLGSASRTGHPLNNHFYVSRTDRIKQPSTLLVSATSRSVDVASAGTGGNIDYGGRPVPYTAASIVVPGYYEITPPQVAGIPLTGGGTVQAWNASNTWNKVTAPVNWGFLDMRHFNKAITTHVDGHVEIQTLTQLRDMRKWSNRATSPTWNYVEGNN